MVFKKKHKSPSPKEPVPGPGPSERIVPVAPMTPGNDTYWRLSSRTKVIKKNFMKRFFLYQMSHELWVMHFFDGGPSYFYCIGLPPGSPSEKVLERLDILKNIPLIEHDLLNEAVRVMTDPETEREYLSFLTVMESFSENFPAADKQILINSHEEQVANWDTIRSFEKIVAMQPSVFVMVVLGLPDLYEVLSLKRFSQVPPAFPSTCEDTEISRRVYELLSDPEYKESYDRLLQIFRYGQDKTTSAFLKKQKKEYSSMERTHYEKLFLVLLSRNDDLRMYLEKPARILEENQDWAEYLPPKKKSFFSVLGLDASLLKGDRTGVEGVLRSRYRTCERSCEVNLAYSVLKNTSTRNDYLWLYENHFFIHFLEHIISSVSDHIASKKKYPRKTPR